MVPTNKSNANITYHKIKRDLNAHELSCAGHLENAISMVFKMPLSPNLVVWHSLLGACKYWGNLWVGKQALTHAIHLNKADARTYVLWSETCANL